MENEKSDILLPDEITGKISPEAILYSLCYDINQNNEFIKGYIAITKECICIYDSILKLREVPFDSITEIKCVLYIGCTALECRLNGEVYELCRADMAYQYEYQDIAAQLEKFRTDKSITLRNNSERRVCPKCGRRFEHGTDFCPRCVSKLKTFKRLMQFLMKYKIFMIIAMVLFAATSAISLVIPYFNRQLIDNYLRPPESVLVGTITFADLFYAILTIFMLRFSVMVINTVRNLAMSKVSNELSNDLRTFVYKKVQELSISRIAKRTAGELMNRISEDTGHMNDFLVYDVPDLMQQAIILIIASAYILMYDWKLMLIIILPTPLFIFSRWISWKYIRRLFHKSWQMASKASTILHDIFSGIREVKSYGTEKDEIKKYNKAIYEQAKVQQKSELFFAVFNPIGWFLINLGTYMILFYVGTQILNKKMTFGEMSQFNMYVNMIYGPLSYAAFLPRRLAHFMTSCAKVFEIIDEKVDVEVSENPVSKNVEGYVDIKNAFFGYKEYEMVLKDVNLTVQPGEMIGIVGRSGAGKSTLINLIMRMYDLHGGTISIDGINIKDYDPVNLRSQIGVVLQETFLFAGTIYENIAYSKPDATRDEIIRAAKLANAHQFIMKLPDSYNTKIGENGRTLSGGERQRIAIARAVLHDPRILILDEATSSLDTETEALIQDALSKLIQNRTTFAIAHRLSTLRNATRLIVIDKGTIAEVGSHVELMKKQGIYYSLVMAQRQMHKVH